MKFEPVPRRVRAAGGPVQVAVLMRAPASDRRGSGAVGVVVAQEQLLQGRRLADQAAHAGVAEHLDQLAEACAVDLGAQRVAVEADVLDALDPAEIAWVADHFGLDGGARQVPHRVQRAALDGPARPDDGHPLAQRLGLGQDVAGQQHRHAAVARLADALLKDVLHQRIQAAAGLVEQQQPGVRRERGDQRDLLPVALRVGAGLLGAGRGRSARSARRGARCRCRRASGPAGRWSRRRSATATA